METKNQRFSITVNKEIGNILKNISKEDNRSVSRIINDLLKEAIDIREDLYLSKIGNEIEKRIECKSRIPAEILWKELDL